MFLTHFGWVAWSSLFPSKLGLKIDDLRMCAQFLKFSLEKIIPKRVHICTRLKVSLLYDILSEPHIFGSGWISEKDFFYSYAKAYCVFLCRSSYCISMIFSK